MYMIVYVCICIYVIENRTNMRFDLFFSPFGSANSSPKNISSSQNFRELHVYLSRDPCWATMSSMKTGVSH